MAEVAKKQRSSKGIKRRNERNILTFYEKIAVIRYYDETNISRNSLAKMFHCCATQIRRILEKKEELLQQLATLSEADASIIIEEMTRKRRKFEMSAISFILHQWVERCRQLGLRKSITNQVLKETALKMAAILNLPTFRPSYRWLNRFRGKYKYSEQDLGADHCNTNNKNNTSAELSVEDIIIEFKDSLPSFMQKEISAITSLAKTMIDEKLNTPDDDSANDCGEDEEDDVSENDGDVEAADIESSRLDLHITTCSPLENSKVNNENSHNAFTASDNSSSSIDETQPSDARVNAINAGTATLLNSVFPHLAVIHQFALLNSDVKALELISQLGVHMQTQASDGVYTQLTLAPTVNNSNQESETVESIYADIDDIVLIE